MSSLTIHIYNMVESSPMSDERALTGVLSEGEKDDIFKKAKVKRDSKAAEVEEVEDAQGPSTHQEVSHFQSCAHL